MRWVKLVIVVLVCMCSFACMKMIENQVADDAVKQYEIAKQQGDKMQICVQAGFAAAAFLQAKDQPNYNKWKAQEKSDCRAAGLPR